MEYINFINWEIVTSLVTAFSTLALFGATIALVIYTKKMASAASYSDVTVTIEPNNWAIPFLNINVMNTGTVEAYDVSVSIEGIDNLHVGEKLPLQKISLLAPNQILTSGFADYRKLENKEIDLSVKWSSKPKSAKFFIKQYSYDLNDYSAFSPMTESNHPITKIAKELHDMNINIKKFQNKR